MAMESKDISYRLLYGKDDIDQKKYPHHHRLRHNDIYRAAVLDFLGFIQGPEGVTLMDEGKAGLTSNYVTHLMEKFLSVNPRVLKAEAALYEKEMENARTSEDQSVPKSAMPGH